MILFQYSKPQILSANDPEIIFPMLNLTTYTKRKVYYEMQNINKRQECKY